MCPNSQMFDDNYGVSIGMIYLLSHNSLYEVTNKNDFLFMLD
jgi:hypothetical protein